MLRNLSSPTDSPSITIAQLTSSFASRSSKRSGSNPVTPPLQPPTDGIDVVELQRLRLENQRNTRLLEEERRNAQDLARRVAELERDLDHIKSQYQKQKDVDITIPKFVVMGPHGILPTDALVSNTSFTSSSSYQGSNRSSRATTPRASGVADDLLAGSISPDRPDGSEPQRRGKPYIAYLLMVERGFPHPPGRVQVLHRFNDFKDLHKAIVKKFGGRCPCIPDLPEKRTGAIFSSTPTTNSEINERRKHLETYLRQMLCIDDIRRSMIMERFLMSNVKEKVEVSEEALVMDDPF